MATNEFIKDRILDPKIEHDITEKSIEFENVAVELARTLSNKTPSQPLSDCSNLSPYIHSIRANYLFLSKTVKLALQVKSDLSLTENDEAFVEEKAKEIDTATKELDKRLEGLELDRSAKKSASSNKSKIVLGLLIFLAILESVVDMGAFAAMGGSKLESLAWGLGVGFCTAILAHELPALFRRCKNNIQKAILFGSAVSLVSAIYYIIGTFRLSSLNASLSSSGTPAEAFATPFVFAIINMFFFLVAVLIASTRLPNKEQQQAALECEEIEKNIEILKVKRSNLLLEKNVRSKELKDVIDLRTKKSDYEEALDNLIEALYQKAVAAFINECIMRRDSPPPPSFSNPIQPLFNQQN